MNAPTKVQENGLTLAAFWWVGTSAQKAEANMVIEDKVVNGITVPILRNKCQLEPFCKLVRCMPIVSKAPRSMPGDSSAAKKKARVSK